MARQTREEAGDVRTLLGEVAQDARTLLSQQLALLRSEVGQELQQAGRAAASLGAGGALAASGGLMSGFMLVQLLHETMGLPKWLCYGLVGGSLGVAGIALLRRGQLGVAGLRPLPQTTEALGENLEWLKNRLTPG